MSKVIDEVTKQSTKQLKKESKVARKAVKAFMRLVRQGRKLTSTSQIEVIATLVAKKKLYVDDLLSVNELLHEVMVGRSIAVPPNAPPPRKSK